MTNKAYRRGYDFENSVAEFLKARHYTVMRSAGSHGPADLLAGNLAYQERIHGKTVDRSILAIQAKRTKKAPGRKDLSAVYEFALSFNATPVIVWAKPRSRKWRWFTVVRSERGITMGEQKGLFSL